MIAQASPAAGPLRTDPSKRVNYTLGLVLGVDEFQQDQLYHAAGRRGHNRLLHGYGTVWGLKVSPVTSGSDPEIQVEAGVAVDPCGREICVPDRMCVKLDRWLDRHKAALQALYPNPEAQAIPVAVVLCHRECPTDTVPVPGEPCRSQDDAMQPSRIRDGFELKLMLRDDAPWETSPPPASTGLGVFRLYQPEEQAVRAFGEILARVQTTTDEALSADGAATLLERVRALVGAASEGTLASPPAPDDDPILLPAASAPDILREAFRVWVTEVRPAIRALESPESCGEGEGECCVLLAEFDLPVTESWAVAAAETAPEEGRRPYLLHTRLLQEWLIAGGGEEGRPDVDSFATLQILGPTRIRVWLHHDEWLNLPQSAVSVVLNDVAIPSEELVSVPWGGIRNVWDIVLPQEMSDGDAVEVRIDSEQVPLISPPPPPQVFEEYVVSPRRARLRKDAELKGGEIPDFPRYRWTPGNADPVEPPVSVADELRGPSGEYLDRYGYVLSAFTIYDRLEGGDLEGEYKLPIVAKIQQTPVDRTKPTDPEQYLRFDGAKWTPSVLPDGTADLRERYPRSKVVGIQGQQVSAAVPQASQYLVFDGAQWVPAFLPDGTADLSLRYPDSKVVGIQGTQVSSATPKKEQYLKFDEVSGKWIPADLPDATDDLTGKYPSLTIARLQGSPVAAGSPGAGQVLAFVGGKWVPAEAVKLLPAAGGDLTGSYPDPKIAKLQGKDVDAGSPSPGQVLAFVGGKWVPADAVGLLPAAGGDLTGSYPAPKLAKLQGKDVDAAAPNPGQVLAFVGGKWVPAAVSGLVGAASGDLAGTYPAPTVAGIRGKGVSPTAPTDGQILVFRESSPPGSGQWVPSAAPASGATGAASGDLAGTYPAPTVARLRGNAVSPNTPLEGQVLIYRAGSTPGTGQWVPGPLPASGATGPAGGDLSGTYPNPQIAALQGRPVAAGAAVNGQSLRFNGDGWVPEFTVGAAAGTYDIVAAARYAVQSGTLSPLGQPYGDLKLDFIDPQQGILQISLPAFDPGSFQYIVKGLWECGVVLIQPANSRGPVIRLFRLDVTFKVGELHLEISRYPAQGSQRRIGVAPASFDALAAPSVADAAVADSSLAAPAATPTRTTRRKA